jgi:uncharacterized UBP type Zn finger protein
VLIPEIPSPDDCFKFIVGDIVFNEVKYYEPRQEVFALLTDIAQANSDFVARLITRIRESVPPDLFTPQCSLELSSDAPYRGIRNMGTTCYMNATIQQLFAVPEFRAALLSANNIAQQWFLEFQYLFGQLLYFPSKFVDSAHFVTQWTDWDGKPVNPREQADAVEFLQMLCQRLEKVLPSITDIFKGRLKYEGPNASQPLDEFLTFPLEVRDYRKIHKSIEAFAATGHIDRGREGERTARIAVCPEILIVQLKRFQFNLSTHEREKVDTYFEFPYRLNICKAPLRLMLISGTI